MRQTFETLIHNYINNSKFEYSYSQDDPSHLKYGLISKFYPKDDVSAKTHHSRIVKATVAKNFRFQFGKWPTYRTIIAPLLYERINNKFSDSLRLAFIKIKEFATMKKIKNISRDKEKIKNILIDKYFSNIGSIIFKKDKLDYFNRLKKLTNKSKGNDFFRKLFRTKRFNQIIGHLILLRNRIKAIDLIYTTKSVAKNNSLVFSWIILLKTYILEKDPSLRKQPIFQTFIEELKLNYFNSIQNYILDSNNNNKTFNNKNIQKIAFKELNIRNIYSYKWWDPNWRHENNRIVKINSNNELSLLNFINKFISKMVVPSPILSFQHCQDLMIVPETVNLENLLNNDKRFKRLCEVCIEKSCKQGCICFCHELSSDEGEYSEYHDSNYLDYNNKKLQLSNVENLSQIHNKSENNVITKKLEKSEENEEIEDESLDENVKNMKMCLTRKMSKENDVDIDHVLRNFKELKKHKNNFYEEYVKYEEEKKQKEDEDSKKNNNNNNNILKKSILTNNSKSHESSEKDLKDMQQNKNLLRNKTAGQDRPKQHILRDVNDQDEYKEVVQGGELNTKIRKKTNDYAYWQK